MVLAVGGAIFFSSSSSITTYSSLPASYPLTISDRSIGLFSSTQYQTSFTRERSFLWSM